MMREHHRAPEKVLLLLILPLCLLLTLTGCSTTAGNNGEPPVEEPPVSEVTTETPAEAESSAETRVSDRQADLTDEESGEPPITAIIEDFTVGGWSELAVDNEDILDALEFFDTWYEENAHDIPVPVTSLTEAPLIGGASQVVSGLNFRLTFDSSENGGLIMVYIYRDLSGTYSVWKIETLSEVIYQTEE
ncbi:MAG: hypothetical protein JEY99_18600 [Spirochaetales bacterium]|nr:hypothetical protein [Spirochaetales bacterium]